MFGMPPPRESHKTNFDCCRAGERLQLHRDGASMHWFGGRKGINHGTRSNYSVLDPVITQRVRSQNSCWTANFLYGTTSGNQSIVS